jgi:hypothetical protein
VGDASVAEGACFWTDGGVSVGVGVGEVVGVGVMVGVGVVVVVGVGVSDGVGVEVCRILSRKAELVLVIVGQLDTLESVGYVPPL